MSKPKKIRRKIRELKKAGAAKALAAYLGDATKGMNGRQTKKLIGTALSKPVPKKYGGRGVVRVPTPFLPYRKKQEMV